MLKTLEEMLSEAQRVDTKAQSALDLKKQNLKDETKKKNDLIKNMEEVKPDWIKDLLFIHNMHLSLLVKTACFIITFERNF